MSGRFTEDINWLDGVDYTELKKFGRFATLTITTSEIDANGTEQFSASESEDVVDTFNLTPSNTDLPNIARVIGLKVNVSSGSTDSRISVYQSQDFNEIDQVVAVKELSESTTPESYMLGSGLGTPFINKEGEDQVYFQVEENSGVASEYGIELYWANIPG